MIKKKDLRIFGLIWAAIFLVIGVYPFASLSDIKWWSLILATVFILVSFFLPTKLIAFYKRWIKLGELIGGIISGMVLIVLYFAIFTPISLVLKILRKDLLNLKINSEEKSYWLDRDVQPQSMKNQF